MSSLFQLSSASIIGRDHHMDSRNSHDALNIVQDERIAVGIVCDGCSGQPGEHLDSEVGAKLGALLLSHTIYNYVFRAWWGDGWISRNINLKMILEQARVHSIARLKGFALDLGPSLSATAYRNMLFTVVGFVITPATSAFFAVGDGYIVVNGQVIQIGPFPDNKPPYFAYGGLVESELATHTPEATRFKIYCEIPTWRLGSFLIGTDGIQDLVSSENLLVPGTQNPVGLFSQFWTDSRYFETRTALQRKLNLVGRNISRVIDGNLVHIHSLLPDDTSMIIGRRAPRVGKSV